MLSIVLILIACNDEESPPTSGDDTGVEQLDDTGSLEDSGKMIPVLQTLKI